MASAAGKSETTGTGATAQDGPNTATVRELGPDADLMQEFDIPEGAQDAVAPHLDPHGATAAELATPAPSGKGTTLVQVLPPNDKFIIEGVPTITREGVMLSASDAKTVGRLGKLNGVGIIVDGDVYRGDK